MLNGHALKILNDNVPAARVLYVTTTDALGQAVFGGQIVTVLPSGFTIRCDDGEIVSKLDPAFIRSAQILTAAAARTEAEKNLALFRRKDNQ